MAYQSPSDYAKLAELEDTQNNIRDILYFQSVHGVSQSSPYGQGRKSAELGPELGAKSWFPMERSVTEVDEAGVATGVFDKLDLHALTTVVKGLVDPIPLKFIQFIGSGVLGDGKIFTLTPETGKDLDIQTGGSFDIAGTIKDTAAGLFQYFANTGKVKCIAMGATSGGGVSFPLIPDVKAHGNASTASPITPDLSAVDAHWHQVTMNADLTINNPTGSPASGKVMTYTFEFTGDGTTRTISWGAAFQDPPQVQATGTTILNFTTTDGGTSYKVYETAFTPVPAGGGGGLDNVVEDLSPQLGGDLDFLTFDATNIDRLRFTVDSATVVSPGDPSMYISDVAMNWNMPTGDNFEWRVQDVTAFFGGNKVGGTEDSFFQVHGLDTVLANLELRNEKATPATGIIGRIGWQSENASNEDILYASITGLNIGLTQFSEEGSLSFNLETGSNLLVSVMSLNANAGGKIHMNMPIRMFDISDYIEMRTAAIYFDELADDTKIEGTSTVMNATVGGALIFQMDSVGVSVLGSAVTFDIPELFFMNATTATGVADGAMWHDAGTGDVLVFSGGAERNLSDIGSGGGTSPPFDDNQTIIQDEVDNTKTLSFNLSLQSTGAANLLSWAVGATRTHTFSATTGVLAQLNLAQTWLAQQTYESGNLLIEDADGSNTMLLASAALTADKTHTFPNNTGMVAELNLAQTWSADQTHTADILSSGGTHNIGNASSGQFNSLYLDNTLFCSNLKVWTGDSDINVFNDLDLQAGVAIDFADIATAAGAGSRTLPSNPQDFITIKVNGVTRRVPFYPV